MPRYKITNPSTGQVLRVTGTRPPTESELQKIFAATAPVDQAPQTTDVSLSISNAPDAASLQQQRQANDVISANEQQRLAREFRQQTGDILQSAAVTGGGMLGGALGGPSGAALGQAGAYGLSQAVRHAADIPGAIADIGRNLQGPDDVVQATKAGAKAGLAQGATDVAKEAAIGAAMQYTGDVATKALAPSAKWMADRALAASQALKREFPDLSETMIRNAVDVTSGGLAKARTLLQSYKADANAALQAGDQAQVPFNVDDVLNVLNDKIATKVANSADIPAAQKIVAKVAGRLKAGRAGVLTATELDALKTDMQSRARAVYKSLANSTKPSHDLLKAETYQQLAQSANELLESQLSQAGITGYKAANSAAQDMIGLTRAVRKQVDKLGGNVLSQALSAPTTVEKIVRGAMIPTAFVSPTTAAVLAAERVLFSPSSLSRLARGTASRAARTAAKVLPPVTTGTLRALMREEQ